MIVYEHLGEGECKQGDGQYGMGFGKQFTDLRPHTQGNNAELALARCKEECNKNSSWCKAIQVTTRDNGPTPSCRLMTDYAAFQSAGMTLENDKWAGDQYIDGVRWFTYCSGGSCTTKVWGGGSLDPREGYNCYIAT